MKKSISKKMVGLLAVLASVGVVHAEDGTFEVTNPTDQQQAIVNKLILHGYIRPLAEHPDWYQINRERLTDAIARERAGDASAQEVIKVLKSIIGDETDIREIDIFNIRLGTQDFRVGQ